MKEALTVQTTKQKKSTVFLVSVWLSLFFGVVAADAAGIAMNFADNDTAEVFSSGELIGLTGIDSNYPNIEATSASIAGAVPTAGNEDFAAHVSYPPSCVNALSVQM